MKILLVGAGGYGEYYLKHLLKNTDPEIIFEGIVEKFRCPMEEEVLAAGIPIYENLEQFYEKHTADLAVIATPAFLHKEQSVFCAEHGSFVLCEKPTAPTVAEAEEMIRAQEKTGKFIAIGFQAAFADETLELKKDILSGRLGKPLAMKTVFCTSRDLAYYARGGGYAGRIQKDGRMILDSVASNACAHYLYNMLFLLGDRLDTSAFAQNLTGECYRANSIENFDTCTLKATTQNGVRIYFAATHANLQDTPYTFVADFEKAQVRWTRDKDELMCAYFHDGTVKVYGNPYAFGIEKKFADCVEAVRCNTVPVCTVSTTLPHLVLIGDIYKNIPIKNFPEEEKVLLEDPRRIAVPGLEEKMMLAFERTCLLSEL